MQCSQYKQSCWCCEKDSVAGGHLQSPSALWTLVHLIQQRVTSKSTLNCVEHNTALIFAIYPTTEAAKSHSLGMVLERWRRQGDPDATTHSPMCASWALIWCLRPVSKSTLTRVCIEGSNCDCDWSSTSEDSWLCTSPSSGVKFTAISW